MNKIEYDGSGTLYITDISTIREGVKPDLDRVITVCQEEVCDNISSDIEYNFYNMSDGDDGYGGSAEYGVFERAADILYHALEQDEVVCIHCHMGQSRSVSVSIAALGRLLGIMPGEAWNIVERYRPQAHPNNLLLDHARQYIEQHTGLHNRPFE